MTIVIEQEYMQSANGSRQLQKPLGMRLGVVATRRTGADSERTVFAGGVSGHTQSVVTSSAVVLALKRQDVAGLTDKSQPAPSVGAPRTSAGGVDIDHSAGVVVSDGVVVSGEEEAKLDVWGGASNVRREEEYERVHGVEVGKEAEAAEVAEAVEEEARMMRAERAGLRVGDQITAINGEIVATNFALGSTREERDSRERELRQVGSSSG
jgi:hypothetical protein